LDQHPLNRRRCRQLCRAGAPRWRPLQFVIQHDAASSDRVTPDLETASSGRPPGHHGFQASARPWTKTTSAFQSVDDAKSLAAGRPGRHHRPPIIFWRQISSSGQDGLQCPSCARPRHMRLGLLAAVLGSPRPLFSPCSPPWSAAASRPAFVRNNPL